jgi:hypothetical protein
MVIYRDTRSGMDMAAVIIQVLEPGVNGNDPGDVHLHVFPPPGAAAPDLSHQFGVAHDPGDRDEPIAGRWRWPDRER